MNSLIVYYSRTGNTRKAAEELSRMLSCDIMGIDDGRKRGGPVGWIRSGYQAVRKKTYPLKPLERDPSTYGMIVLCTPVWAGKMSTPIRSFLKEFGGSIHRYSMICCQGSEKDQGVFADMRGLIGKDEHASLFISDKWWNDNSAQEKIEEFASSIR